MPLTPDTMELEIRQLLQDLGDPDLVADALLKRSEQVELTPEDQKSIAAFLFEGGYYPSLMMFLTKDLTRSTILWNFLGEGVGAVTSRLDPELIKALEEGAKEKNALSELCWTGGMDGYIKTAENYRQQGRDLRIQGFLDRRRKLLDDIDFLKSQNLLDRERSLLEELAHVFPQEKAQDTLFADWKERKSFDVLGRKPSRPVYKKVIETPHSPEIREALEMIHASCLEVLEDTPDMAMDFCMMMLWFEDFERATYFLLRTPHSPARNWFQVELLLRQRKAVEALGLITETELITASDPETPFVAAYYRAQALWQMEQKDRAVHILEGLIDSRPQYRLASSLLSVWRGLR